MVDQLVQLSFIASVGNRDLLSAVVVVVPVEVGFVELPVLDPECAVAVGSSLALTAGVDVVGVQDRDDVDEGASSVSGGGYRRDQASAQA